MWNIILVSPQGHRSVSVSRHFLLQAPQCPCSVQKWFSRDHCCRGSSKPGCRIAGRTLGKSYLITRRDACISDTISPCCVWLLVKGLEHHKLIVHLTSTWGSLKTAVTDCVHGVSSPLQPQQQQHDAVPATHDVACCTTSKLLPLFEERPPLNSVTAYTRCCLFSILTFII